MAAWREIRIGLVGAGRRGRAYSLGFRNVTLTFGPEPAVPVLEFVCDTRTERSAHLARTFGFGRITSRWQDVVSDPLVDAVAIAVPTVAVKEVALAAIANGKHVCSDVPVALSARDAGEIASAAKRAGVVTAGGFIYLKNPLQALAMKLINTNVLGEIRFFRGTFDQDILTDPTSPFSWRMDPAIAGSGALGHMGSHVIGLALALCGPIQQVSGMSRVFQASRPLLADGAKEASNHLAEVRQVQNEDCVHFLCEFESGAIGEFAVNRMGTGRKQSLTYEIQGSLGAITFNQERMNELNLFCQNEPRETRGYKTIYTGPDHSGYSAFHPLPGHALSHSDQKTLEVHEFIQAIVGETVVGGDFAFGHQVARVVDAVLRSAKCQSWDAVSKIE